MAAPFGYTEPEPGTVVYFNGDPANIPAGWVFCDGLNGTPDLRGRFIKGTPDTATEAGAIGGQDSKTITQSQLPSHDHSVAGTDTTGDHSHNILYDNIGYQDGSNSYYEVHRTSYSDTMDSAGAHSHTISVGQTGGDGSMENRPSYIEYVPIMKA